MLRMLASLVLLALLCGVVGSVPGPAGAQAPPTLPGNLTFQRTVAPLDVTVGDTVHVSITLDFDNIRTSRGADVFLVVDRTPTMFNTAVNRVTYMDATKEALTNLLNSMDFSKDQAGMITYADNSSVARNLSADRDALLQSVRTIRMAEEDDVRGLLDAFRTATQKLDNDGTPGNQKLIFIVVAGPDKNQNLLSMPTVTQAARNAGVQVVFLMINAAYSHYVAASSDCSWNYCPTWVSATGSNPQQKYAWNVGVSGSSDIRTVMRTLVEHFFFDPSLAEITVKEDFDPANVSLLPDSVVPPPDRTVGPPFYEAEWEIDSPTHGPFTIDYDVRAEYPDDTYPVASVSQLVLLTSDGQTIGPIDMPNPPITVHGIGTPSSPTVTPEPATATPTGVTPTTPPPPSVTAQTPTDTPSPTNIPNEFLAYLPAAWRNSH